MQNFPILFRFNDPSMPSALNNLKLHWQVVRGTEGPSTSPTVQQILLGFSWSNFKWLLLGFAWPVNLQARRQKDSKTDGNNRWITMVIKLHMKRSEVGATLFFIPALGEFLGDTCDSCDSRTGPKWKG